MTAPSSPIPSTVFPKVDIVIFMRPLANKTGKALRSLDTIDKLFERAFAPRASISSVDGLNPNPRTRSVDLRRPMAPEPPETSYDSPLEPPGQKTPKMSLDPIWDEVRQTKERELAASPSKVKSLEVVMSSAAIAAPALRPEHPTTRKVVKRKSSVSFKEAPDGRTVTAAFETTGVKKEDMHVSFRADRVVVTWRTVRMMEKREGDTVFRDREEKRHSHTIPLPEGTKFEEIRASRDGKHLMLTYPKSRCIRIDSPAAAVNNDKVRH